MVDFLAVCGRPARDLCALLIFPVADRYGMLNAKAVSSARQTRRTRQARLLNADCYLLL
jgi:hypothetical protein